MDILFKAFDRLITNENDNVVKDTIWSLIEILKDH